MELRHLKYFITLAEELSFVRAANKLCIAQPPLSRQIKELENEVGAKLFDRNNKRVQLTVAGQYFKKEVDELMKSLESIKVRTKKLGENINGEYSIAYISSTFSGDISALLQYLGDKYPYVNFRLYEVPTQKQIAALELGKIDLGIVRGPISSPKVQTKFWYRDSFSWVFRADKQLNRLQDLKNEKFVFFNKDYAPQYYQMLLEICAVYGFLPKVVHEANNVSSILQMVKNGLGLSIIPSNTLKSHGADGLGHKTIEDPRFFSDVLIALPSQEYKEIDKAAVEFLLQKQRGALSV